MQSSSGFSLGNTNSSFGGFSGFFSNSFLREQLGVPSTPLFTDSSSSNNTTNVSANTSVEATPTVAPPVPVTPQAAAVASFQTVSTSTSSTSNSSSPSVTSSSLNPSSTSTPSPQSVEASIAVTVTPVPSSNTIASASQVQLPQLPAKAMLSNQFQIPLLHQQAIEANKSSPGASSFTPLNFTGLPPTNSNAIVDNLMKNSKLEPQPSQEMIERPPEGKMFVEVTPYLIFSQSDAAKMIGIPSSTLSKRWKEATLNRKWPFRTVQKLDREILTLLRNLEGYKARGEDNYISAAAESTLVKLLRIRKEELRQVYVRLN